MSSVKEREGNKLIYPSSHYLLKAFMSGSADWKLRHAAVSWYTYQATAPRRER